MFPLLVVVGLRVSENGVMVIVQWGQKFKELWGDMVVVAAYHECSVAKTYLQWLMWPFLCYEKIFY